MVIGRQLTVRRWLGGAYVLDTLSPIYTETNVVYEKIKH